jgi:hypothetical protein
MSEGFFQNLLRFSLCDTCRAKIYWVSPSSQTSVQRMDEAVFGHVTSQLAKCRAQRLLTTRARFIPRWGRKNGERGLVKYAKPPGHLHFYQHSTEVQVDCLDSREYISRRAMVHIISIRIVFENVLTHQFMTFIN